MPKLVHKESLADGERAERFYEVVGKLGSIEGAAKELGLSTATPWYHMRKNPEFKMAVYKAIEDGRAAREASIIAELDRHAAMRMKQSVDILRNDNGEPILNDDFEYIEVTNMTPQEIAQLRRSYTSGNAKDVAAAAAAGAAAGAVVAEVFEIRLTNGQTLHRKQTGTIEKPCESEVIDVEPLEIQRGSTD